MPLKTPLTEAAQAVLDTGMLRQEVFDVIPEGASRILDIGYGDGRLLLRLMTEKNCTECCGIEINPSEVLTPYLDQNWSLDLTSEDLPDKYHGYFKWIILHDVLEHIYNPWEFLGIVNKYLAPDGHVVIVCPNAQYWELSYSLLTGNWPLGVNGYWNEDHIRWFTFKTLCETAIIAGLSVEQGFLQYPSRTKQHIQQYQEFMAQTKSHVLEMPPIDFPAGHIDDGLPFTSPSNNASQTLKVMLDKPATEILPYILAIKTMLVCSKRSEPGSVDIHPGGFKPSRKALYEQLGVEEIQKRSPKDIQIQIIQQK